MHEQGLPIVLAIEAAENMSARRSAERAAGRVDIFRKMGQAEPQHVHRRGHANRLDSSEMTHPREPAVGAHGQQRAQLMNAVVGLIADAANDAVFSNQLGHVRAHQEPEAGVSRGLLRQQTSRSFWWTIRM